MTSVLSQEAVFAIFGIICLCGVLFITKCVPETRGHTLEEIEQQGIEHGAAKDERLEARMNH